MNVVGFPNMHKNCVKVWYNFTKETRLTGGDFMKNEDNKLSFLESNDILTDMQQIIEQAKGNAYKAINLALIRRNWLIGYRIEREILKNKDRAKYGLELIQNLAKHLNNKYGKGFTKSNLYSFYLFYKSYPQIFHSVNGKSENLLSWTHYKVLLKVSDKTARTWYEKEAYEQTWSVRTLQRNIETQYYYRLLASQKKEPVVAEMQEKTKIYQQDKLEFIKNPMITEFLGLKSDSSFTESKLEESIITNLQKFIMELGKGYAFVARQQHIHTEEADYYIDLVFYNYILKCFVLIDLKAEKLSYQDVGQMDMYVKMFDEFKRRPDDNPTLGLLLCAETNADVAKYSILHGNEQLFAAKYKLYLPTEEELREEIERQKAIFYLQQNV